MKRKEALKTEKHDPSLVNKLQFHLYFELSALAPEADLTSWHAFYCTAIEPPNHFFDCPLNNLTVFYSLQTHLVDCREVEAVAWACRESASKT